MDSLTVLRTIEDLVVASEGLVRHRTLAHAGVPGGARLPIYALELGAEDPRLPTLGLFGGVHGLEEVGTHVVVAYLHSLVSLLRWDAHARARLESCRIVAVPLVNPGGMAMRRRSNPAGVDLMRNAPVEALDDPHPLIGGHRYGPFLPWYRGRAGAPMELEARTLAEVVEGCFEAEALLTLDFHSGFGMRDRLWYPYAKTHGYFPRVVEARRLARRLDTTYPNHIYKVEPQSESYVTHGDLWDWLFDRHRERHGPDGPVFLPWTLEMGSWNWVRKNPRQLLSVTGPFNPVLPHRRERAMRRHLVLADFFLRAAHNHRTWT